MSNSQKVYLGLDPGIEGAIAVLDGRKIQIVDIPTLTVKDGKKERDYTDIDELLLVMRELTVPFFAAGREIMAILEDVHATPQMKVGMKTIGKGPIAQFALGHSKGILETVCKCSNLPLVRVRPEVWKKALGLAGKEKDASIKLAKDLFPEAAELLRFKSKDGRAEALLIAAYGAGLRLKDTASISKV